MKGFQVFCVLGIVLTLFVYPAPLFSGEAVLNVTVLYAEESHDFDSSNSFSESLENSNDTSFDISFPEDSLSTGNEIRMQMESTDEVAVVASRPLSSGKLAANTFYDLSFTKTSDSSSVTSFDKPITLTFHYTDSDISGIDESTLVAHRWNGSSWVSLDNNAVDTGLNTVIATTQQFSFFSLIGDAPTPAASCGDGSCNGNETCSTCSADCGSCGGGGGGGGIITSVTKVTFKGRAYPDSDITILRNAQVAATTKAGLDANFEIQLSGLSSGTHTFGVWAENSKGNRSITHTFTISVTSGVTTVISGIFIPPTIFVEKTEVKRGDNLNILGQSVPEADITVFINSNEELVKRITADESGVWLYKFDTSEIEYGDHSTRAKAAKNNDITTFSKVIAFKVGDRNILAELPEKTVSPAKGDTNSDKRVNLVDFSIVAYWYKRPSPLASVDLNNDGKVDLIDFSILAFYWTG
ncbi:MAG: dockerin type I repeat-containing protein [Candidatus Pacebacteria bacterium]|nr:dockerin type I repeat-containing protein [Candidatus Paceibacterota bacterium]